MEPKELSLAVIDDIVARGGLSDWTRLCDAVFHDPLAAEKVVHVTNAYIDNPPAQRQHFWNAYARQ